MESGQNSASEESEAEDEEEAAATEAKVEPTAADAAPEEPASYKTEEQEPSSSSMLLPETLATQEQHYVCEWRVSDSGQQCGARLETRDVSTEAFWRSTTAGADTSPRVQALEHHALTHVPSSTAASSMDASASQ